MTKEIDRRTLVKSAAWSLPVIALAVGAPAQAASLPGCAKHTYAFTALSQNDVAEILIETGNFVQVNYKKSYHNATAININGRIVWKSPDKGVDAGFSYVVDLTTLGICDPTFIQVDGNNMHYYGNGVFR